MKMKNLKALILVVIPMILMFGASCAPTGKYEKIAPAEAKAILDGDDSIILLDVRTPEEYEASHIKGAVLIPDYDLKATAPSKLPDKDAKIIVYCRSGNRSRASALVLLGMGYRDVSDLGGIIDWPYETVSGQ